MKTEKSKQNLFKMIQNFPLRYFKKLKEQELRYRFGFLFVAAAVGIVLAVVWYFNPAIDLNGRLATNFTILLLSLIALCLLWFFKTRGTNEQIQKTQENTNTSMLHKAIDLVLANRTNGKNETDSKNRIIIDPVKRSMGLQMLAKLRLTNPEFKIQIDSVTKRINLKRVNLVDADLQGVDLEEADLQWVNLQGADLQWANLKGTDLRGVNLQGADLEGADLEKVNLKRAFLKDVNLKETDLRGANLREANLREANLREADLKGANLRRANLKGTDLQDADLQGADLRGINLEGADLQGADLLGANLRDADLRGVNLQGTDLEGALLEEAFYNSTTIFPQDFNPQDAGMIEE